jgi:hypothetical protein
VYFHKEQEVLPLPLPALFCFLSGQNPLTSSEHKNNKRARDNLIQKVVGAEFIGTQRKESKIQN